MMFHLPIDLKIQKNENICNETKVQILKKIRREKIGLMKADLITNYYFSLT